MPHGLGLVSLTDTFTCLSTYLYTFSRLVDCLSLPILLRPGHALEEGGGDARQRNTQESSTGQCNARADRADRDAQMRFVCNSHWLAPGARTLPRLRVCGGIQVLRRSPGLGPYRRVRLCEGGCGRHSLLMQCSTRAARHARANRSARQNRAAHYTPEQPTHAQPPLPTNKACTQSIIRGPQPHTPTPTLHPPHTTTKATRTHTTQKGCFRDALSGANTIRTTPGREGGPNLSKGVALAGGWQPATRLTIGQRPKTCTAHE